MKWCGAGARTGLAWAANAVPLSRATAAVARYRLDHVVAADRARAQDGYWRLIAPPGWFAKFISPTVRVELEIAGLVQPGFLSKGLARWTVRR